MPPLPPPPSLKGMSTVMLVLVDSAGAVVKDSTVVCGVPDASYAARMAYNIAQIPFEPGRQNGRAVASHAEIGYRF